MKHKKLLLTTAIILISITIVFFSHFEINIVYKVDKEEKRTNKNVLSMMIETEASSGKYQKYESNEWPTEGYILNIEKSGCEQGSKLIWDEETKKVLMIGNSSDKCYVYFDIYVEPAVLASEYIKNLYTGTQGENNIYFHDSSLTNGANDNSYRFAGTSASVKNYVCFGSDEEICPDEYLYRIIGVFDNRVKLIKADYALNEWLDIDGEWGHELNRVDATYLGKLTRLVYYYWNYKTPPVTVRNTWSTSLLNTVNLNTHYLENIGSEWSSYIATTTWKVGGNTKANISETNVINAYQNEIINPVTTNTTDNATTYDAKIGLLYTSDYGYSFPQDYWSYQFSNYVSIRNSSWMYLGESEWTITRESGSTASNFIVSSTGIVDYISGMPSPNLVRPVFYLNDDVTFIKGNTGSETDPYRLR